MTVHSRRRPAFLILLLWLAGGLLWSPVQAAHLMTGPPHGPVADLPCAGAEAEQAAAHTHCQGTDHNSTPCSCTQACQATGMPAALAPARLSQATPTVNVARADDRLSGFHTSPWRPPSTPLPV